ARLVHCAHSAATNQTNDIQLREERLQFGYARRLEGAIASLSGARGAGEASLQQTLRAYLAHRRVGWQRFSAIVTGDVRFHVTPFHHLLREKASLVARIYEN